MPLSWNEIKNRAVAFSKEWESASRERAEAQGFLIAFFNIFGVSQRKVATFEKDVIKLDGHRGLIDMLWKQVILVEMKSRGEDLDEAYKQARGYIDGLLDYEIPKFILICDFENFHLYNLDDDEKHEFKLNNLVNNVHLFSDIAGYERAEAYEKSDVDVKATEKMAQIHDYLREAGYGGHQLEVFLVRLVFCMFADDSVLFNKNIFTDFIINHTRKDGSDLGARLIELFVILNTPIEKRMTNLDESLAVFPYVNGSLFEEQLMFPAFNSKIREVLLESCRLNWSAVSPAIFGSMFQNVIDQDLRRSLGAHFTSEKNILRLIKPLFLDKLWEKFEAIKHSKSKLQAFHEEIARMRFFDPACGCGNFLVVTYREMRKLELEILKILYKGQTQLDIKNIIKLDVDLYYGIEIEEFPAKVAELALWLTDHQMNVAVHREFGQFFVRLPLEKKANIFHGNALRVDWNSLSDRPFDYILGNPPFSNDKKTMSKERKKEITDSYYNLTGSGVFDYVTAWYAKAAEYIEKHMETRVAFVSTNSISQGEQVGMLWQYLISRFGIKINFAHKTFKWSNEAKGNAAVYCVIIGFSLKNDKDKRIFEYKDIKGEPREIKVSHINPYLVEGKDVFIIKKTKPICPVPNIIFGNMPNDDNGKLIFEESEREEFLKIEPQAEKYFKLFLSDKEFINGIKKWCLWFVDVNPTELRKLPEVQKRLNDIKNRREKSNRKRTKELAAFPYLFGEIRQPTKGMHILIPRHSSEQRKYIPLGYINSDAIIGDTCVFVKDASLYHFGVLTSEMHMAWVRHVCGRLESRFRYSNSIVYNNYPWPENPTEKQRQAIEQAAQAVLDARAKYPDASLADLYDPLTMPPDLVKAHHALDKAVDRAYRPQPFPNEAKRMEFLFELYDKYTIGLVAGEKKRK